MLKLYGREYCGLCTSMRDQLAVLGLAVIWIDVDDDPEMEARYGDLVPVLVTSTGVEICHYHLDQTALGAYLAELS